MQHDLKSRIESDMKDAMKAKDSVRVGVLRMMKSKITYGEQATQKITAERAVEKFHKELVDSLTLLDTDRKQTVQMEIRIIEPYLPKKASEDDIKALIATLDLKGKFGDLMKEAKTKLPDADGGVLSRLLKEAQAALPKEQV